MLPAEQWAVELLLPPERVAVRRPYAAPTLRVRVALEQAALRPSLIGKVLGTEKSRHYLREFELMRVQGSYAYVPLPAAFAAQRAQQAAAAGTREVAAGAMAYAAAGAQHAAASAQQAARQAAAAGAQQAAPGSRLARSGGAGSDGRGVQRQRRGVPVQRLSSFAWRQVQLKDDPVGPLTAWEPWERSRVTMELAGFSK